MGLHEDNAQDYAKYQAELGLNNARMAEALGVSPNTAAGYLKRCPEAVIELMAWWVLSKRRLEAIGLVVKPKPKPRGKPYG
jgi:hypothetical protein